MSSSPINIATSPPTPPALNTNFVLASTSPLSPGLSDRFSRRISINKPLSATDNVRYPKVLHPAENEGLKLLILENISQEAVAVFQAQGFHVDHSTKAMSEDELVAKIPEYHAIGIRSKTKITERVIKAAPKVGTRPIQFRVAF